MLVRIRIISCTLLMMLTMPKLMKSARTTAVMRRELSAIHSIQLACIPKVKSGTLTGVERTKNMATAPLMMPTRKAAAIAIFDMMLEEGQL